MTQGVSEDRAETAEWEALKKSAGEDDRVWLVVYPSGGVAGAYVGDQSRDLAHRFASAVNGVVVAVPIAADYRTSGAR